MQPNTLGRLTMLSILITSIILALWEFGGLHRHMQFAGPLTFTNSQSTSYSFRQTNDINNQLTKIVRIDRPHRAHRRIAICSVAQEYESAHQTTLSRTKYPTFYVSQSRADGIWSKEAALLEVLRKELSVPTYQRLEWLAWIDQESSLLDETLPLETFLPPFNAAKAIQMLHTDDIMMFKVSHWSVAFLSAVIARQASRDEDELDYPDRWTVEDVMRSEEYSHHVVEFPSWWLESSSEGDVAWGMPSEKLERMRAFWERLSWKRRSSSSSTWDDPRKRFWD